MERGVHLPRLRLARRHCNQMTITLVQESCLVFGTELCLQADLTLSCNLALSINVTVPLMS